MVLQAGKLAAQHGLTVGQLLHVKCGDDRLFRRLISVAIAGWDEPEDLATLIFEFRGKGAKRLSQRREGDKLDVLGAPWGTALTCPRRAATCWWGRHRRAAAD